jgi:hypothetical protein
VITVIAPDTRPKRSEWEKPPSSSIINKFYESALIDKLNKSVLLGVGYSDAD